MLSILECRERAGLGSHEVVLGVTPCAHHDKLLASYLLNLEKGERFVLEMIVADLRGFLDLGAPDYAGDVFVVLRTFLDGRPQLSLRGRERRMAAWPDLAKAPDASRTPQDAFPAASFEVLGGDGRAAI